MKKKKVDMANFVPELAPDENALAEMVSEFKVFCGIASVNGWAEFSKSPEYAKFVKGTRSGKSLVNMLYKAYKAGWESGVYFSLDYFKQQLMIAVEEKKVCIGKLKQTRKPSTSKEASLSR